MSPLGLRGTMVRLLSYRRLAPRYDRTATTVYVLTGVAAADMAEALAIRR